MTMPNRNLCSARDVAIFLETATPSEFVEAFVMWQKFHDTDSLDITEGDITTFDIQNCVKNIDYTLTEILGITHGLEMGA